MVKNGQKRPFQGANFLSSKKERENGREGNFFFHYFNIQTYWNWSRENRMTFIFSVQSSREGKTGAGREGGERERVKCRFLYIVSIIIEIGIDSVKIG